MLPTSGNWKETVTRVSSVCFSICPYPSCTATWLDITSDWAAPPTLDRVYHVFHAQCYTVFGTHFTPWMAFDLFEEVGRNAWIVVNSTLATNTDILPVVLRFTLWLLWVFPYTLPLALSSRSDEGIDILARLPLGRERSATSLMLGNAYDSLLSTAMLCARSAERSRHESKNTVHEILTCLPMFSPVMLSVCPVPICCSNTLAAYSP